MNVITVEDKVNLFPEFIRLRDEKDGNIQQARLFRVPTEEYEMEHNALMAYLEPFVADLNTESPADEQEWWGVFMRYYTSSRNLIYAIKEKI